MNNGMTRWHFVTLLRQSSRGVFTTIPASRSQPWQLSLWHFWFLLSLFLAFFHHIESFLLCQLVIYLLPIDFSNNPKASLDTENKSVFLSLLYWAHDRENPHQKYGM